MQERWEQQDAEYASSADASKGKVKRFYPFSSGSRDCAGQSLARMNYTATVTMLVACFSFKLAKEVKVTVWSPLSKQYGNVGVAFLNPEVLAL